MSFDDGVMWTQAPVARMCSDSGECRPNDVNRWLQILSGDMTDSV